MRFTMLVSAVALSFATIVGSASAKDQFATLGGINATPMSSGELSAVKGMHRHFRNPAFDVNGKTLVAGTLKDNDGDGTPNNWFFNGSADGK